MGKIVLKLKILTELNQQREINSLKENISIYKIQNTVDEFKGRLDIAEDKINDFENRSMENF